MNWSHLVVKTSLVITMSLLLMMQEWSHARMILYVAHTCAFEALRAPFQLTNDCYPLFPPPVFFSSPIVGQLETAGVNGELAQ